MARKSKKDEAKIEETASLGDDPTLAASQSAPDETSKSDDPQPNPPETPDVPETTDETGTPDVPETPEQSDTSGQDETAEPEVKEFNVPLDQLMEVNFTDEKSGLIFRLDAYRFNGLFILRPYYPPKKEE